MRFRIEQRFPAPPGDVQAALLDDGFLAAMAELPKLGAPEKLDERREGRLVHRRVRHRFTGSVSSAVRMVVDPARLTWVEEATTDLDALRTDFTIVPDHYGRLLRCSATIRLTPDGGGTLRATEGTVEVKVPLFGGQVEAAIVSGLREHADAEVEAFDHWQASRRD